jgi:TPR repeat protein
MPDQHKLPAKTTSGGSLFSGAQPGSLVARGLQALKRRKELRSDERADTISKLLKAAEQGDAEAQLNLGWEYTSGDLIPRDHDKALDWWHKSADQGCAAAQNSLGWHYSIVEKYIVAYFWLGLAHDSTSDVGPKFIYHPYYTDPYHIKFFMEELRSRRSNHGRSELAIENDTLGLTPMKITQNIEPLMTSVQIAEAQFFIGEAYYEGDSAPQNYARAIRWSMQAAERGYQEAMYMLGCIYADDEGGHRDFIKAYMWFSISNGGFRGHGWVFISPSADEQIGYLEPAMTPEEIDEAQRLAQEWIEAHAS